MSSDAGAPAGAKAPAAATIAAAATWPDFSDGNLGPDSKDDYLGPDSTDFSVHSDFPVHSEFSVHLVPFWLIVFGSCLDRLGIMLGSRWSHFGVMLG